MNPTNTFTLNEGNSLVYTNRISREVVLTWTVKYISEGTCSISSPRRGVYVNTRFKAKRIVSYLTTNQVIGT